MSITSVIKWAIRRANEPSTWAGAATVALGVAQVASTAEQAVKTFKADGVVPGLIAVSLGLAAILKSETKKPDQGPIIDGDFTVVPPSAHEPVNETP